MDGWSRMLVSIYEGTIIYKEVSKDMDNLTVWNEIMQDKYISQDWKDLINAGILSGLSLEEVLDAVLEGVAVRNFLVAFSASDN